MALAKWRAVSGLLRVVAGLVGLGRKSFFPEGAHNFPESERQAAYQFLDKFLK
jgi:hypothetical protein